MMRSWSGVGVGDQPLLRPLNLMWMLMLPVALILFSQNRNAIEMGREMEKMCLHSEGFVRLCLRESEKWDREQTDQAKRGSKEGAKQTAETNFPLVFRPDGKDWEKVRAQSCWLLVMAANARFNCLDGQKKAMRIASILATEWKWGDEGRLASTANTTVYVCSEWKEESTQDSKERDRSTNGFEWSGTVHYHCAAPEVCFLQRRMLLNWMYVYVYGRNTHAHRQQSHRWHVPRGDSGTIVQPQGQ